MMKWKLWITSDLGNHCNVAEGTAPF